MKKMLMLASALCFVFASCTNNASETTEATEKESQEMQCPDKGPKCHMTEEQKAECEAFKKEWDNWENLADEAKKDLITKAKANYDEKLSQAKSQAESMLAKIAEKEAAWADFETKTLDEQKSMLDDAMKCCKGTKDGKGCCKGAKDGDKPCCKDKKDGEKPCCKKGDKEAK